MGVSTDAILAWGYAHNEAWEPDDERRYDDLRRGLAEMGVELGRHCSNTYEMPYVAVEASVKLAARGCPLAIRSLEVRPKWREALKRAMAVLRVEEPELAAVFKGRRPGWFLASHWGNSDG